MKRYPTKKERLDRAISESHYSANEKWRKALRLAELVMKGLIVFLIFASPIHAETIVIRYSIKAPGITNKNVIVGPGADRSQTVASSGLKIQKSPPASASNLGRHTGSILTPDSHKLLSPTPAPTKGETTAARVPKTYVESLICKYFGADCQTAIAICKAESGCRPEAVGDGGLAYVKDGVEYGKSYGVFQLRFLPGRPTPEQLLDAEFNIQYAYNLFKRSSWHPWSVYKSGSYLKFL